jgi:hypothetical protein
MPSYSIRKDGKQVGFIRGDLGPHCAGPHCADCGAVSDNLCDYPVGDDKTCDRSLCDEHSHQVGIDIHYCDTHKKHWDKFKRVGGVKADLENVVPFKN